MDADLVRILRYIEAKAKRDGTDTLYAALSYIDDLQQAFRDNPCYELDYLGLGIMESYMLEEVDGDVRVVTNIAGHRL